MKNLKRKKENSWIREVLFPLVLFACISVITVFATSYFEKMSNMQNIDMLRQSAKKAIVQCYAIEGAYPPNVEYLEENYGLEYNHDKYFVDYEIYASNLMPYVDVFERQ